MHGLDIIIRHNAEAAGREEAHARNDGDHRRARLILEESVYSVDTDAKDYERGYRRGREEG